MKIELTVKKEFEVKTLQVEAGVRYWEDSTINGLNDDEKGSNIPCRESSTWKPLIDIETGVILNWEKGKEASIHYKVCDNGEYWLLDEQGNRVVKAKGYYVPDMLSIDDEGYGDYIIMEIDKDGKINNWRFDQEPFTNDEEE